MLEYSLIKQHRPRFNVRLRDDKSYPFLAVTVERRVAPADGDAGPASARACATSGPTATPTPSARRSTCCCARSRSAPAATTSSTATSSSAGRACCSTSRSARARASGEIDKPEYDRARRRTCSSSSTATPTRSSSGSSSRCARRPTALEFERAARLRDRLTAVRKAIEKQQMVADRNEDLDVIGIADDDLEAAVQVFYVRKGRVVGRKGFVLDKVEDLTPARARRPTSLEGLYDEDPPLGVPKQVLVPSDPDDPELYEQWLAQTAGLDGRHPGARSAATSATLQETVTRNAARGVHPPPAAAGGDHNSRARALNELQDGARPARGPAAHRVLRHEPHPGHRLRRLDGGAWRTGCRRSREYRRFKIKRRAGQRRLRRHGGGAHPAPHRLPRRAGRSRSAERPASSPTRRSCCWSTAARASSAWPCGCSRSWASTRRSRSPSLAKRFEEVFVPGRGRPDPHPAAVRGAVPAAAHPRRGPPLRHHLPPPAARQAHDQVGARRHPRPRPDPPASGSLKELGGVTGGEAGAARGAAGAVAGCPTTVAEAVYEQDPQRRRQPGGLAGPGRPS